MIQTPTKTFMFNHGAIFIACDEPRRCGGECQAMHFLFVNRNGKSLCLMCDAKQLQVAASERMPGDDPGAAQTFEGAIV